MSCIIHTKYLNQFEGNSEHMLNTNFTYPLDAQISDSHPLCSKRLLIQQYSFKIRIYHIELKICVILTYINLRLQARNKNIFRFHKKV